MGRRALLLAALAATAVVVVVGGLAATACDSGGDAPAAAVTARPTQVLPTPYPTRTPLVVPTPELVTPVPAAEGGRPDCATDWAAYNDPDGRFSFCYPRTLRGISERSLMTGTAVQLEASDFATSRPEERVFLLASWRPSSYLQGPGPASLCSVFAQAGEVSRQEGKITVAELEASTCLTEVHQITPGVGVTDQIDHYQLMVEIPRPSGGFVLIRGVYFGPDFEPSRATLMQMLNSVAVK